MAQSQGGQAVKRYRFSKHLNLGPAHGFTIHTPNNLILKDVHPQFIVRELNRLNGKIKRLESVKDSYSDVLRAIDKWMRQHKAKEDKP